MDKHFNMGDEEHVRTLEELIDLINSNGGYISSIKYSLGEDAKFSEKVTLIGNDKKWGNKMGEDKLKQLLKQLKRYVTHYYNHEDMTSGCDYSPSEGEEYYDPDIDPEDCTCGLAELLLEVDNILNEKKEGEDG